MQAIICNKEHPDWGCATIPLPIPDEEYSHCLELLKQLQIGGVTASDCYIDQLTGAPPALDVLERQEVNIDELDFLARSLDRYTDEELAKFQSVAAGATTSTPAPTAPEDTPPTVLFLPTPQERLERLLARGGYQGAEDVHVTAWRSDLPDGVNDWLNIPREGLRDLNRLCQAVEGMGARELAHLAAAALLAQPEDAEQLRRLAENLESFEFIPNVGTAEELGRFMIQQSGHFEYDPNLEGFYDYAKYGKQRLEQQNGGFTELGYVCYTGTMSIEELMLEGPAELERQEQKEEQGLTMGGMM